MWWGVGDVVGGEKQCLLTDDCVGVVVACSCKGALGSIKMNEACLTHTLLLWMTGYKL